MAQKYHIKKAQDISVNLLLKTGNLEHKILLNLGILGIFTHIMGNKDSKMIMSVIGSVI